MTIIDKGQGLGINVLNPHIYTDNYYFIYSQGSLSDVDEDSLDQSPPLLLEGIESDTKDTCTISPSHKSLGSPSAHVAVADQPPLTTPSCCSELTDDAQTLMDDFGFNINAAAPHVGSDSPRIVMDEKEEEKGEAPSDLSPSPITNDALLDDFGFNIEIAAPCADSDAPCILMDEKEEEGGEKEEAPSDLVPSPPEPAATTEPPQSLLDDFGFNIRLSSPHKGRDSPNKVHRRGSKSNEVSPSSSELRTKYLMKFDSDLSSTHTKKNKLATVNWSPTKAQIIMEFDTNITPSDTDKDTPPSTEEKVEGTLDNPLASPSSTEKNSDGQNLLDQFEFKAALSNPLTGESSSEQRSDAQSLLGDFGFESNTCTSATPVGNGIDVPVANMTGAAVDDPSTETSANTQTLLDDFGFDINVSAPCTSKTVLDAQMTDYSCAALPSNNSEPPASRVVPLIAFSNDTVRLWEERQKEDQSHTTITRHRSQSPPNPNKTDEQTPNEVQSSEKADPAGGDSVDRTAAATYEKTDMVDSDVVGGDVGGGGGVGERERVNGDRGVMERREQSRLLARSKQLAKCSPADPEEPVAHRNATFTMSDSSSPSNLEQDSGKNN